MGEDWGDAASRLAALREVRTIMTMCVMDHCGDDGGDSSDDG